MYFIYILNYIFIRLISLINILYPTSSENINNNLIVSFTTIPSRSSYITNTINSILMQTVLPRKIVIGIPKIANREPNLKYKFPKSILKNDLIEIVKYDEDKGPIMKLLTGIDNSKDNELIITIDDDTIYEKHLIESLLKYKDGETVFCTIGRNQKNEKCFGNTILLPEITTTLEGYGGVLYNKNNFIDNKINDFLKTTSEKQKFNDDLLISYFLKKNSIFIKRIPYSIKEPITSSFFTKNTNPLWMINENKGYFKETSQYYNLFN